MPEEKLQTLSLQVINGSELESGRAARCLFTQQGNVGHGPECHWSVQDRHLNSKTMSAGCNNFLIPPRYSRWKPGCR